MRPTWEGFHAALAHSLLTAAAAAQFRRLRDSASDLAAFDSAPALVDYLTPRTENLDDKDRVYAALVRSAQADARLAPIAYTLLLCGLWPGLDRIYRHRVWLYRARADEIPAVIFGTFTALIARLDLGKVHRVASTLVRSTDRDTREALRKMQGEGAWSTDPRLDDPQSAGLTPAAPRDEWTINSDEMEEEATDVDALEDPQGPSTTFLLELTELRRTLLPVLGDDTDLLLDVVVLEELQSQVAVRLGLTPSAARKRFQRAMRRLRQHLESQNSLTSDAEKGESEYAFIK
jgi:RNA polymerase sigma-70 factor (ECF subfamily)